MTTQYQYRGHQKIILWTRHRIGKSSPEAGNSTKEDQILSAYSIKEPHLITQAEVNKLDRDFDFCKIKKQLPGSRLHEWNFPEKNVK